MRIFCNFGLQTGSVSTLSWMNLQDHQNSSKFSHNEIFRNSTEKIAHGNKEKTKQSVGLSSMSCSKVKKLELKFDSVWYPMRPMKYVVSTNKIVLTEEFHWVWFIRWYWLGVFVFQILKISHWKNIHASSAAPAPSNL